jgi:hypothetical protein
MTRIVVVLAFALLLVLPALAQDTVLMQIQADYEAWRVHLADQYWRGMSRAEYERQLQTLDLNIEARRQARLAELQRAA